jgi:hypothetical protein
MHTVPRARRFESISPNEGPVGDSFDIPNGTDKLGSRRRAGLVAVGNLQHYPIPIVNLNTRCTNVRKPLANQSSELGHLDREPGLPIDPRLPLSLLEQGALFSLKLALKILMEAHRTTPLHYTSGSCRPVVHQAARFEHGAKTCRRTSSMSGTLPVSECWSVLERARCGCADSAAQFRCARY